MVKNILVTGGAGYVGSPFVGLLLSNNYNVVVVDNLSFGGDSLLNIWHHPNFKFIKGDITSLDFIETVFKDNKIEAVVHLAAIVGDPACAKQPELARKVNWEASMNLLDLSVRNGAKRFIFASTCSNYGKMSGSNGYVKETSPLVPVSLYAKLKVKFENVILNEMKKKDNFCPTSLRFSTVYGISPRMRFDLTVNEFTKELVLGRELEVFGEQFWRPYCHVYDFARAMMLVLNSDREKVAYNVFNVGDTNGNYQKQMIVDEIKMFIPKAKVKYVHKDEDPKDYRVSFEKIRSELGFNISRNLEYGIMEIKDLIDSNILADPDSSKYRNI
jgi:nucleoside-diphosphate-sugar epimerase|tara:strand:+ start:111 stop:1097 length:987 start_codon:yes stop_codon:yes gene_type:complete